MVLKLGKFSQLSAATSCLLALACGGQSEGDRQQAAPREYRFETTVAGQDHYCGITLGDRRLVCIEGGKVVFDDAGPFRSLDLNDDLGAVWDYRCAVKETGELSCWGLEDVVLPTGEFSDVSVGVFNACASRPSGELECWIPETIGGMGGARSAGQYFSVNMWSYCWQRDGLYAECFDSAGNQLLPSDGSGHFLGGLYMNVRAAPEAGCAAILAAVPADYSGTALEPFAEILSKNNIACFSADGASSKIDGTFPAFDVNANADGCALTGSEDSPVACWGNLANSVPADLAGNFMQISVSGSQACMLDAEGAVSCFRF